MEARGVQGLDQLGSVEIAGHFKGALLRLGGVGLDAVDLFHRRFDGLAAGPAAIVHAGQLQALDLASGGAAVVLDGHVFVVSRAMEAALGQRIQRLLGGLVIVGRNRHHLLLLIADYFGAVHFLDDIAYRIDAAAATKVDPFQFNRGLGASSAGPEKQTKQAGQHRQS